MTYVNRVDKWLCYGGDGLKTWFAYETTKGHEEDGLKELTNNSTSYFSIEGYKVDIAPVLKPEDALQLIGLTPPGQIEKYCMKQWDGDSDSVLEMIYPPPLCLDPFSVV